MVEHYVGSWSLLRTAGGNLEKFCLGFWRRCVSDFGGVQVLCPHAHPRSRTLQAQCVLDQGWCWTDGHRDRQGCPSFCFQYQYGSWFLQDCCSHEVCNDFSNSARIWFVVLHMHAWRVSVYTCAHVLFLFWNGVSPLNCRQQLPVMKDTLNIWWISQLSFA